jgi:hypothetical protein
MKKVSVLSCLFLVAVISISAEEFIMPVKTDKTLKLWTVTTTEEFLSAVKQVQQYGGTIDLAPGAYVITEPIEFTNLVQITIRGSGWNTAIQRSGAGDAIVFNNVGHSSIRDLRIVADPNSDKGSGILLKNGSSSNYISYCRIEGFAKSGIYFEGTVDKQMSSNSVKDCHFINNREHQLHSLYNNDFYFTGNQFGRHGINPPLSGTFLESASAGTYAENYHWDNLVAFRMEKSNFNRIENNRFEESHESGIIVGSPVDNWVTIYNIFVGNTVHSNSKTNSGKYTAVVAYNSVYTTFTQNQVFSWGDDLTKNCIELGVGCKKWIMKDNIFKSYKEKSIVLEEPAEDAGHIIKDNIDK